MTARIGLAACVFGGAEMMPVARHAGFDFLLVDMEHGAISLAEAATLCVAGREAGYPIHVRVPNGDSEQVTRIVDCGAHGLVVPHVDSAAQARRIVEKVRFAPMGGRSIPSPVALVGFRPLPAAELIRRSEAALEVAVMIESAAGLADVEAISAIDGIDTVMVGANDLAQSLGLTGRLDHPDVLAAFDRIAEAARLNRRFGIIGVPPDLMPTHAIALGAGIIVAGNEINLLFEACEARVTAMRELASAAAQIRRQEPGAVEPKEKNPS